MRGSGPSDGVPSAVVRGIVAPRPVWYRRSRSPPRKPRKPRTPSDPIVCAIASYALIEGTIEATALTRGSYAATGSTTPPPSEIPQTARRSGSTSSQPAKKLKAFRRSSSWSPGKI